MRVFRSHSSYGIYFYTVELSMTTTRVYIRTAKQNQGSTPVGFEPTRGDPIGLAGRRLSHSAKVSDADNVQVQWSQLELALSCPSCTLVPWHHIQTWVHSSVVRAADCRSAGPWFKSGCALRENVQLSVHSAQAGGVGGVGGMFPLLGGI